MFFVFASSAAHALEFSQYEINQRDGRHSSSQLNDSYHLSANSKPGYRAYGHDQNSGYRNAISTRSNPYKVLRNQVSPSLAQNNGRSSRQNIRSRSEVMKEVKRRYNAQVLKIVLNDNASAYRVRILMPNGRVKEVSVSATR